MNPIPPEDDESPPASTVESLLTETKEAQIGRMAGCVWLGKRLLMIALGLWAIYELYRCSSAR